MRVLFSGIVLSLANFEGQGLRRQSRSSQTQQSEQGAITDTVMCPGLSALATAGELRPDSFGRVPADMFTSAVISTGGSPFVAAFVSGGAAYLKNDTHQNVRMSGPAWAHITDTRYVNLHTMSGRNRCTRGMRNTANGHPCNLNPQFVQHGASTTIMDPGSSVSAEKRFWDWFGADGVLERPHLFAEREMTMKGLGKLLERVRLQGDFSGEYSLNASQGLSGSNMAFFHPSITDPANYVPMSQWQPVFVWAGFMDAFSRERKGKKYVPVSDLKDFFLRGQFPRTWQKRAWGMGTTFKIVPELKGTGAGDEIIQVLENMLATVGQDADDGTLLQAFIGTLASFGAFDDDVSSPMP